MIPEPGSQPTPGSQVNIEAILARHTVKRVVLVGPVLIAMFWMLRGTEGGIAAAVGVALVVVNFLLAGAIMSLAARLSLAMYHAAALLGFALRLGLITVTMLVVARLFEIDRLAFGLTAVTAYLVLIGWEAVAVARGKERELEWTK
ncbi:MAG TPA: hypothetical protein VM470_09660 [Acidimicrobiia bacterium]|nr:hypothetical protein [Acidimicrobiia bacterium]